MDAQGALDSLLGRLSAILIGEAQLLGGLHGDVEFIKDEMESMNGLLHHLTEAQYRDHQVRAWMKQVVGLARDCEGNVELYIHNVAGAGNHASGFLGYLQQIVRYVRTIPERHRIATRIRELKVKARDVLDRQQRYGVTVPPATDQDDAIFTDDVQAASDEPESEDEDARKRALLVNCSWSEDKEAYEQKIMDDTIKSILLSEEGPVERLANRESQPRIFLMIWKKYGGTHKMDEVDRDFTNRIIQKLYNREISSFSCKALVEVNTSAYRPLVPLLQKILDQVAKQDPHRMETEQSSQKVGKAVELTKTLGGYLRGKRFLIILQVDDHDYMKDWNRIWSAVLDATAHGSPGSAIVIAASSAHLVGPPYEMLKPQTLFGTFCSETKELDKGCEDDVHRSAIERILELCYPDVFAMKMFQHLLYVNHGLGVTQLENFEKTLSECKGLKKSVGKQMLRFCYNELPTKYRSCLLYLTIFPQGHLIRRTTVCRRWITEGLITSREKRAEDEADCCFDALLSRGLIQPGEIGAMGKIKTCTLHPVVHEVMTRIARDINFVDMDLPPNLARRLPIHSRIGMLAADCNDIVAFLPALAKSSQWQLIKMLDLEGCKGLKKQHLKSICKIILLKYLSLRNTGINKLPKQIEKLQCLETLDIRQTAVQSFTTGSIMLPMLKHLLSGPKGSPGNISDGSQDSFRVVRLPRGIKGMEKLETLSHAEASNNVNDLTDVGHLIRLRKLGVILSAEKGGLRVLLQQIEKLHDCLRSLSIQINQAISKTDDTPYAEEVVTLASPPKLLQSLNISGIRSGLLTWIAELDQLTKITLTETYLSEDYASILGKLTALRCLRLRRNSYTGSGFTFKDGEFKSLKSLVVDDGIITNITFDTGAAPKLETIVWSFGTMESISGVGGLPKLKKVELNGDNVPDPVRQVLEKHPNHPEFKYKPRHGHQGDGATAAASTSMSK